MYFFPSFFFFFEILFIRLKFLSTPSQIRIQCFSLFFFFLNTTRQALLLIGILEKLFQTYMHIYHFILITVLLVGLLQGALVVKNSPASGGDSRDVGSINGLGRFLGEGNGNPLQYSCLGNPMDRGAWETTVHGIAKNLT